MKLINKHKQLMAWKYSLCGIVIFTLTACAEDPPAYELILRGGTIIDGSSQEAYVGDVAVSGSTIAAIGDLAAASAEVEIDVSGLVVAPGFINIHSHGRGEALSTAVNMISQGVTTAIMNSDGSSPLDIAEQFSAYAEAGLAMNVGGFVGFNSVWAEVVGLEDTRPTPAQITRMQVLIREGLEAGSWGVSAGLDYVPGYYAQTQEVIDILSPFADWNVVFANHDRLTPETDYSSIVGMTETIRIGEAAGLIPLVTHIKVQGWEQGKAAEILEAMRLADTSNSEGAVADVYPYLAGQTDLSNLIIPGWAQAGGRGPCWSVFRMRRCVHR